MKNHPAIAPKRGGAVFSLLLLLGAFSSPALWAETAPASLLPKPVNRGGAEGLKASTGKITRIDVVDSDTGALRWTFSPQETDRLKSLLRKSGIGRDSLAMTPPPWPVALVFHVRPRGSYAAHLVGHAGLRLNLEDPFSARIVGRDGVRRVAQDLFLSDADPWLWDILEARLGPSQVKQYASVILEEPMMPSIDKISFSTIGRGGRAFVHFSPDGSVLGGHISARMPPMVHEDRKKIAPADQKALWAAAEAVLQEKIAPVEPDPGWGESRRILEISRAGIPPFTLSWKDDADPPAHEKVKTLLDLILKHRVGGW